MFQRLSLIVVAVLIASVFVCSDVATAQNNGAGISLAPTKIELTASPNQKISQTIQVRNLGSKALTLAVSFRDFSSSADKSGNPTLLKDGESNAAHGLASHMTGAASLTLPAGSTKEYSYAVTAPSNASGTYYASVAFMPAGGLSASVASLVFLTVGQPAVKAQLSRFELLTKPILDTAWQAKFEVEVENQAEAFITPDITIAIKDSSGREVATIKPTDSGMVLPSSARIYSFEWQGTLQSAKAYTASATAVIAGLPAPLTKDIDLYKPPAAAAPNQPQTSGKDKKPLLLAAMAGIILFASLASVLLLQRRRKLKALAPSAPVAHQPEIIAPMSRVSSPPPGTKPKIQG
jgi:hypothetical protein